MYRYGKISEIGAGDMLGYARVYFDDMDYVSYWLSLPTTGTKGRKQWTCFAIDTQVAVMMHEDGEQGEIVKAVWSDDDRPPSWASKDTEGSQYSDGTKVYYDAASHKLTVELCSGGTIETNGKNEVLDAIMTVINAPVTIAEPGNGSPSALQAALKTAITGKNQGKWKAL